MCKHSHQRAACFFEGGTPLARKSKYEHSSAKLSTALWKPALYIRLSREDGDREESNSIASQRELLTEFVDTQTDMTAPRLYTDDGYTGTDFAGVR